MIKNIVFITLLILAIWTSIDFFVGIAFDEQESDCGIFQIFQKQSSIQDTGECLPDKQKFCESMDFTKSDYDYFNDTKYLKCSKIINHDIRQKYFKWDNIDFKGRP